MLLYIFRNELLLKRLYDFSSFYSSSNNTFTFLPNRRTRILTVIIEIVGHQFFEDFYNSFVLTFYQYNP